jgi:hypothetical protein
MRQPKECPPEKCYSLFGLTAEVQLSVHQHKKQTNRDRPKASNHGKDSDITDLHLMIFGSEGWLGAIVSL